MPIECSFCSTTKSERYLYTECGHLVCINCAALRASENLQCCNVMTELDEGVKALLKEKKDKILSNLQNQYKYERTDVNKIGLTQLQERLKKIDNMQSRPRRKYQQEEYEPEIPTADDQQLKQTPINQFYKNPLILEQHQYEVPQTTPIKMVSSQAEQDDHNEGKYDQKETFNPMSQQKLQRRTQTQIIKRSERKQQQVNKNEFNSVLQKSIRSVRQEFKGMYEQLQKMQANLVYQMKIYFEQYVNLIEKENSHQVTPSQLVEIESQPISNFLDQFVQEWNLKDITKLLLSKQGLITSNFIKEPPKYTEHEVLDKRKIIYSNPIVPLQSCRLNQPMSHRHNDKKDDFLDKLSLSESNETQNKVQPATVTGRNLDRIYKKLQESRSKLQERIQIHNEFMSRRYIKLGNH